MRLALIILGLVFALDQATKYYVVHMLGLAQQRSIDVLPPFLNFRMAWNTGVNFGLFASDVSVMRWVLVAVALAVSTWVWFWARSEVKAAGDGAPRVQIAAGLLVGGALGNVVDRLLYGAVADFINMSCCGFRNPFSFNIADASIFLGAIGLVIFTGAKKTP
jgi:signal peptidase II